MPPEGKTALNMNIDKALMEKVEAFRFQQRFDTKSEAIEFLLDFALRQKPKRSDKEVG